MSVKIIGRCNFETIPIHDAVVYATREFNDTSVVEFIEFVISRAIVSTNAIKE